MDYLCEEHSLADFTLIDLLLLTVKLGAIRFLAFDDGLSAAEQDGGRVDGAVFASVGLVGLVGGEVSLVEG